MHNYMKMLFCAVLTTAISYIAAADVLIFTYAYNRPDFIEQQHRTFQKFLQDDYTFVVFNDARDSSMADQIEAECDRFGIQCVRIPQEIHDRPYLHREPGVPYHNPNVRHVNCIQYSLNEMGFDHDGILILIDSDMFLTRPINMAQVMKDHDIISHMKGTKDRSGNECVYLWPGLCFLHMGRLPNKKDINFNCGIINGGSFDSGGYTYLYLKNNPSIRSEQIPKICSYHVFCPDRFAPAHMLRQMPNVPEAQKPDKYRQMGFNDKEIKFLLQKPDSIEFYFDNHFLHYRAGTNYDGQPGSYEYCKTQIINQFIDDIVG